MTTTFHHPCRLLPRLILCGLIAAAACRALAQPPRSETARDWRRHATAIAAFDADGTPPEAMPMHNEMSDAVFMKSVDPSTHLASTRSFMSHITTTHSYSSGSIRSSGSLSRASSQSRLSSAA